MFRETLAFVVFALLLWQSHSEIQCLMGSSKGLNHNLGLINCTHQYQTQQEVLNDGNSTHVNVSYSYHHPETKGQEHPDIDYCLIFIYVSENDEAKSKADFMCDFHYKCDNMTNSLGLHSSIEYKGNLGNLYCCNTTGCNDRRKLNDLLVSPEIKCKVGNVNSTNSATLADKRCPGTYCMKRRVWKSHGKETSSEYNCALGELCRGDYKVGENHCKNVTYEGRRQELCCCSSPYCNSLSTSWDANTQTLPSTPLAPMPSRPNADQKHNTWHFVGGIGAALVFGILLFAIVAIVIKKYKKQKNNEETYTYTQLTADLAETPERDTDDEHMIEG